MVSGLASIPALHHSEEHGQHCADQGSIPGQSVADLEGEAEHPLAHRHQQQDFLGQTRCRVGHTPTHATGTETPFLAGERHDPTLAAVFTPYPQKPMSENAALEVSPHFLRYVPWQLAVCCLQLCQKRLQVARHRPIQGLGFRLATVGMPHPTARNRPAVSPQRKCHHPLAIGTDVTQQCETLHTSDLAVDRSLGMP